MDETSSTLIFFVNGRKVVDNNPDPSQTLLTYLRTKLRYVMSNDFVTHHRLLHNMSWVKFPHFSDIFF